MKNLTMRGRVVINILAVLVVITILSIVGAIETAGI